MIAATLAAPSVAVKRISSPGFSHAEAIGHGHARRCKERHLVALTEGLEKRNLLDRLDIELRKAHRRGDLARVLEGLGRELQRAQRRADREDHPAGRREASRPRRPHARQSG